MRWRLPELPEWLDKHYITKQNWPAWRDAVLAAHSPENEEQLSLNTPSRERLAYDEVLANQLALALVRSQRRRRTGRSIKSSGDLRQKLLDSIPFSLTPSQVAAADEITADLASDQRMHRLLQGDVGSGKTVVALLAMAAAIEAGHQAALLAPTEILARQHFATIEPLARAAGISIQLYTGRDKGTARAAIWRGSKRVALNLPSVHMRFSRKGLSSRTLYSRLLMNSTGLAFISALPCRVRERPLMCW